MEKALRTVYEEYLLRLGISELQVEGIKRVLGVKSKLSNEDLLDELTYPSKRLEGRETKLEEHHYQHLLNSTPQPNYTKNTLSGSWFKSSNFSGQFLRIAGKDKKDEYHENQVNKIINDLCPLAATSKEYINVTVLLPKLEVDEISTEQHHELEGYNAKWEWHKLRQSQVKSQIEKDDTWSLKLLLAFSFMGLADTSIEKKNGSKLLYNLLNTCDLLRDFNFYDSTLYKEWLQTNDQIPNKVENIFTHTHDNSAYLTVSDKIAKGIGEATLVKELPLPSAELNIKKRTQFASTSALKDRGSKDPSHFINSASNIQLGLNYLFCMTSGTAITLQIPIEPVGAKMKHWQLNTPLIIAPIEWIKLIEGTKKKKTGDKREKYDINQLPTNEDGSPLQFKDLQSVTDAQKHKLMSKAFEKSVDVNDDADFSGQLYRGMPHINLDVEW
jgi:hypothetical protein